MKTYSTQQHIVELRTRLLLIAFTYLLALAICFNYAQEIYNFLLIPLKNSSASSHRIIYTHLTEAFFTYLKISLYAAFFLSFPFLTIQIYSFVAPGLYRNEKYIIIPLLIAIPTLFFLGVYFAFYYVIPAAWAFFLSFENNNTQLIPIVLEAKISDYLDLVLDLLIAFGLAFQMPVVLILLTFARIIDATVLIKFRKYAIVLIFIVAAVLTPPDIISQVALAIPLLLLYEISIVLCRAIRFFRINQNA